MSSRLELTIARRLSFSREQRAFTRGVSIFAALGMASFSDVLDETQAQAIRSYVVSTANETMTAENSSTPTQAEH